MTPGFASGYINYYYYGFVLAGRGRLSCWGSCPRSLINLILPHLFLFHGNGCLFLRMETCFPNLGRRTEEKPGGRPKTIWQARPSAGPMGLGTDFGVLRVDPGQPGHDSDDLSGFSENRLRPGITLTTGNVFERLAWFPLRASVCILPDMDFTYYPGGLVLDSQPHHPGANLSQSFPYFTFLYGDPPRAHVCLSHHHSGAFAGCRRCSRNRLGGRKIGHILLQLTAGALFHWHAENRPTPGIYPVFLFHGGSGVWAMCFSVTQPCRRNSFPYLHEKNPQDHVE